MNKEASLVDGCLRLSFWFSLWRRRFPSQPSVRAASPEQTSGCSGQESALGAAGPLPSLVRFKLRDGKQKRCFSSTYKHYNEKIWTYWQSKKISCFFRQTSDPRRGCPSFLSVRGCSGLEALCAASQMIRSRTGAAFHFSWCVVVGPRSSLFTYLLPSAHWKLEVLAILMLGPAQFPPPPVVGCEHAHLCAFTFQGNLFHLPYTETRNLSIDCNNLY